MTVSARAVAARLNNAKGTLLLLSAAHATTHAYAALMPLVFPAAANELKLSYTDIGLLVGLTQFAGGMLQLVYGFLSRYILRKTLLALGQLVLGVGTLLSGAAQNFPALFAGNLAARVGSSPQHPLGNSLLAERFSVAERGSALSLHVVGGNIGTVLVPVVGGMLLSVIGWRATLFIFAVPAFVLTAVLFGFLGEERRTAGAQPKNTVPTAQIVRHVLSDRTMLLIMAASVIGAAGRGLGALNTYLPLYLSRDLQSGPTTVNLLYTALLIGGVLGPLVLGKLSDRSGRKPTLYLTYIAATTFLLVFLGLGAAVPWVLAAVLFGLGISAHADSVILTAFLADVTDPHQRDIAFSIFFAVAFGIGSLWPTVLGYVADHYGLVATFMAMAATYLAAGLCVLPTRGK